jgi:hypothetical protein
MPLYHPITRNPTSEKARTDSRPQPVARARWATIAFTLRSLSLEESRHKSTAWHELHGALNDMYHALSSDSRRREKQSASGLPLRRTLPARALRRRLSRHPGAQALPRSVWTRQNLQKNRLSRVVPGEGRCAAVRMPRTGSVPQRGSRPARCAQPFSGGGGGSLGPEK